MALVMLSPWGWGCEENRKLATWCACLPAKMAGLQVGRKIYSINEDLVFLRPFAEVESILNQSFCSRRPVRLLVATKAKE